MSALCNRPGLYLSRYSIVTLRVCTCGPVMSSARLLVLDPWSTVAYKVGSPWIGLPQGCPIELDSWEFEGLVKLLRTLSLLMTQSRFCAMEVFTFHFWDTHRHPVVH